MVPSTGRVETVTPSSASPCDPWMFPPRIACAEGFGPRAVADRPKATRLRAIAIHIHGPNLDIPPPPRSFVRREIQGLQISDDLVYLFRLQGILPSGHPRGAVQD